MSLLLILPHGCYRQHGYCRVSEATPGFCQAPIYPRNARHRICIGGGSVTASQAHRLGCGSTSINSADPFMYPRMTLNELTDPLYYQITTTGFRFAMCATWIRQPMFHVRCSIPIQHSELGGVDVP
ncbi:hypothetical protein BJ165DRAFT_671452 [Panaeolus papilionaceus]|nr:hypothetical protein BJ165DRAFT_671452 [Panaeolus papilionaceus]